LEDLRVDGSIIHCNITLRLINVYELVSNNIHNTLIASIVLKWVNVKNKGKVQHTTFHEGTEGEWRYHSTLSAGGPGLD
jgi:hypothetical protein